MSPKRQLDANDQTVSNKRSQSEEVPKETTREAQIRRAKERIAQLKAKQEAKKEAQQTTPTPEPPKETPGRGLNVELHPLLTGKEIPKPVENPNLQKVNKRGYVVNPYLDSIKPARPKRELKFAEKGQYINQANELRKQQKLEETKRRIEESRRKAGLEPDLTIHEDRYKLAAPPSIEWWDEPFTHDNDLTRPNLDSVSIYLQHPVPIIAPWERHQPDPRAPHLTKKEMKKKRRIERAERYQEQQDRIRLGLEPPPPPKVKLSNLMSALTNEAIRDPTAVEQRVRKEVEQRRLQHEATNQERKLTKEQRHEKLAEKMEKDVQRGYFSAVFMVDKLENPSHKFKVDTNATQLGLKGTVVYGSSLVLVVIEGSEKSVRFYKKLMLQRIKWDQETVVNGEEIDLRGNKCELVWEGQLKEFNFQKWGVFRAVDDQGAIQYLSRFGHVDSYYREALIKQKQRST